MADDTKVVVAGALLLGPQQDVAVKQDNLMRAQGKSMYGVILKMTKGDIPYEQKAVDAAIAQLEQSVPTIPKVFETNPKEDVVNANYGSSQKIWQSKADFDSKVPPVAKTIADVKGLKIAYDAIQAKRADCHDTYRLKLK